LLPTFGAKLFRLRCAAGGEPVDPAGEPARARHSGAVTARRAHARRGLQPHQAPRGL